MSLFRPSPTPLTPRQMLVGRIPGVLSLWASQPTTSTAVRLLAVWAGLQRLAPEEAPPVQAGLEDDLDETVRRDRQALVDAAVQVADPLDLATWLTVWEGTAAGEDLEDLLYQLDEAALVEWAVGQLTGREIRADWDTAWRAVARRAHGLVGLVPEIEALYRALRPDLFEVSPDLEETLSPFQYVLEWHDMEAVSHNP